jgi:hypothetical protein
MESETRPPFEASSNFTGPGLDGVWFKDLMLGLLGAAVGGVLGYVVFFLLVKQGLYAMILPGTLMGMGCAALSGRRSRLLGAACAVAAVVLGIYSEWQFAPFVADKSFMFFLRNLHRMIPLHLLMIVVGAVVAYWIGVGRTGGSWPRTRYSH